MDLELSEKDRAFRDEVRGFIRDALPDDIREKTQLGRTLEKDDYLRWQKALHARGWMGVGWPVEHGGPDWTPVQRYIFEEETGLAGCPRIIPFGLRMVGPVIIAFGTEAQKREHLPKILSSEIWWCQGYSEPGAGSDLASLKTKAVRAKDDQGDHYIVNGEKTWTTLAQYADWIFCLVRTDETAKKQEGISFLLIDMSSPGVTVKPITTLDGGREVNEVFFDDVRVPVENRVGAENQGWTVAKYLLGHERTNIAEVGRSKNQLAKLKEIAAAEIADGFDGEGARLIDDPLFRDKIARVEIDLTALDMTLLRIVSAESAGRAPGPEASLLKIRATEVQQAITELLIEAVGYYGFPYQPGVIEPGVSDRGRNEPPVGPDYAPAIAPHYFNHRKASIYGGSNEVQRGIIAKMVLGF